VISIIVSYYKTEKLQRLKENIAHTIGAAHEIIDIYNPGRHSLSEAYNMGAAKAGFPILCFMHDDLLLLTHDWGARIAAVLQQQFDLVGVAGSTYKSLLPTGWASGLPQLDHYHIYIQRPWGRELYSSVQQNDTKQLQPAVVLDGVFMACRLEVWQANPFNERLDGFHCYDLDFSMRASLQFRVGVCLDIDMVHDSAGNFGTEWIRQTLAYHSGNRSLIKALHELHGWNESMPHDKAIARFWLHRLRAEQVVPRWRWNFARAMLPVIGIRNLLSEAYSMLRSAISHKRRQMAFS
jgi:GT2 family glycosyltransferase